MVSTGCARRHLLCSAHEQQIGLQRKLDGRNSQNTVAMTPRPLHSSLAALLAHTWSAYICSTVEVAAGAKLGANCSADGRVHTRAVTTDRYCTKEDRASSAHFRMNIMDD